jgi:type II secretory pathway component GspD/PulD (secretin)
MKTKHLALCLILSLSAGAALGGGQPISMIFSDTDVSQALKAISVRTHVNIIYAGKEKIPVTVNVKVDTPEEAIRSVASSSGLIYREVNGIFVVASSKDMKQALEPYAHTVEFRVNPGKADELAAKLADSVPYATFRSFGGKVSMTGVVDDIRLVRRILADYDSDLEARNYTSEVVALRYAKPLDISPVLASLYPDMKTTPTGGESGGSIALQGSEADVQAATKALARMDRAPEGQDPSDLVFRVYLLKYVSGPEIVDFLKKAMPEVQAITGPEQYQTPRPQFSPLSASLGGGASALLSGGGSGGGEGGGAGGASGGAAGQQGGATGGIGGTGTIRKPGDKAKAIVLRGPQLLVEQAYELISKLDVKPIQVMIECRVMETSPSFAENLGLDWNLTNTQTVTEGAPGASGIGFGTFTRTTPLSFSATLNATITKGEAKILADPKVQASDNSDAFIFVGDTVQVAVTSVGALGAQTVTPLAFPILTIRPRVSPDGTITMHVNPVVSTITGYGTGGLPNTSSREAETTAIVKDGETIAIGGLISDQFTRTIDEVPFLSQLPLIGELFKNRNTTHNKEDIIVTLTPHIVRDPEGGSK